MILWAAWLPCPAALHGRDESCTHGPINLKQESQIYTASWAKRLSSLVLVSSSSCIV